jgi:pimeloyl-ACP methyl ester carboxylesterase
MNAFYVSDGARLNFRDSGAGVPVVFVHPTPLDQEYWRPLTEDLAGVRAIVPDLRGHGGSELGQNLPVGGFRSVPDAPVLTMSQLASDILALLDHLKVSEAVFAGCSIGGYVLLEGVEQEASSFPLESFLQNHLHDLANDGLNGVRVFKKGKVISPRGYDWS